MHQLREVEEQQGRTNMAILQKYLYSKYSEKDMGETLRSMSNTS